MFRKGTTHTRSLHCARADSAPSDAENEAACPLAFIATRGRGQILITEPTMQAEGYGVRNRDSANHCTWSITSTVIIEAVTGEELKSARLASAWTQIDAAAKLGITQAYLSMVERGDRAVSDELAAKAVKVLKVQATALPIGQTQRRRPDESNFQKALGSLGYPGFAYLRRSPKINPAELLMEAIDSENLDSRVVEALPWLPLAYPNMDWTWLISNAKARDRQNRLAFVTVLASQVAGEKGDAATNTILMGEVKTLERSRLAPEDTLCNQALTEAERKWLRVHRSQTAKHWNLLTDLGVEQLDYAAK